MRLHSRWWAPVWDSGVKLNTEEFTFDTKFEIIGN